MLIRDAGEFIALEGFLVDNCAPSRDRGVGRQGGFIGREGNGHFLMGEVIYIRSIVQSPIKGDQTFWYNPQFSLIPSCPLSIQSRRPCFDRLRFELEQV